MKNIFLILILFFIFSCEPVDKKLYRIEITYDNGDKEVLTLQGYGYNYFSLENGDLRTGNPRISIVSGVRNFKVLSIIAQGKALETDHTFTPVKIIETEKIK